MTLSESEERTLLAALVAGLFLLLGGPIGYNPDGLEMIALARSWRGELPADPASGYWPPLWPALIAVASEFSAPEQAGRLLNLAVAGLTAGPLHLLASGLANRLSGKMLGRRVEARSAGRVAVVLYALLPSVLIHAPVLDARPVGSFLLCSCAAWAVKAEKWQDWAMAGACGMLASLARPEGLALLPILALAAFLKGGGWKSLLLLTGMLPALLRPGSRGWESFTGPWLSIWPTTDLLALYGPSSLPTGYREFVLRAKEAGLEKGEIPLTNLLAGVPDGLKLLMEGLPGALGGLGTVLGVVTILELCSRGWRSATLTAAGSSLIGVLVLLPMARDQATPATNFGFVVPVACALVGLLLMALGGRQPLLAALLGLGMEAEARYGPFRVGTPWFCEGTDASRTMRLWLQEHPPESGKVACRMAGRGVVIAAGLQPLSLPSSWEEWEAPPQTGVLLASADLQGADGGRGLELLQDPHWQVEMLSFEGQSSYWEAAIGGAQQGRPPPTLPPQNHWMIYLEPRP